MVSDLGRENLNYKISAFLEDIIEENGKNNLKALTTGAIIGIITLNPNIRETILPLAFYTQPITIEQGYRIISETIKELLKQYANKVVETYDLIENN